MIQKYDYENKCWWCNDIANSREHRFKRTDVVREFGNSPFPKGSVIKTPGNFIVDKALPIQGPNSNYLKFQINICHKCNSSRSRNYDIAYDKFMDYLKNNEETIFSTHEVNLYNVYGSNWRDGYSNLIKYYIKNICTRFAENMIFIEPEIINFLASESHLNHLSINFQIRTDWAEFYKTIKSSNVDYGYLHASAIEAERSKSLGSYYWLGGFLQYRWFQVQYFYQKGNSHFQTYLYPNEIIKLTEFYVELPEIINESMRTAVTKSSNF